MRGIDLESHTPGFIAEAATLYARGSTLSMRLARTAWHGYPVCAGIDLILYPRALPRLPLHARDRPMEVSSTASYAYPVCAGIDHGSVKHCVSLPRLPRMRGDRPQITLDEDGLAMATRMRGDRPARATPASTIADPGYPVCAGIDLRVPRLNDFLQGYPMRGDRPVPKRSACITVTPYARGIDRRERHAVQG